MPWTLPLEGQSGFFSAVIIIVLDIFHLAASVRPPDQLGATAIPLYHTLAKALLGAARVAPVISDLPQDKSSTCS